MTPGAKALEVHHAWTHRRGREGGEQVLTLLIGVWREEDMRWITVRWREGGLKREGEIVCERASKRYRESVSESMRER